MDSIKNQLIPKENLINSLSSSINIEHLSVCKCQQHLIQEKFKEYFDEEIKDLINKNNDKNTALIESRKEFALDKAKKWVSEYCKTKNIKCPIEKEKIIQHLQFFENKYDLSDPRVFVIVESLLNQMLSVHRFQLYSNEHGVLNIWYDKNDNKRVSLNPVEQIKLEYDKARIDAIAILDKIIEGEKLNIDMKVINIDEVFKNIELKPGEYREI